MIEEGLKGEIETPDGVNVADYLFDPRFVPTETSLDLRIALITWKNEQRTQKKLLNVDPFTVVFLQKLVDERLQRERPDLWLDLLLGRALPEIKEIVESAYQWESAGSTREEADQIIRQIEKHGIIELFKRCGRRCGYKPCSIPLAIYDEEKRQLGKQLAECPGCQSLFKNEKQNARLLHKPTNSYQQDVQIEGYIPLHLEAYDALSIDGIFEGMVGGSLEEKCQVFYTSKL